jgi:phosphate transport system substrate-binding protein
MVGRFVATALALVVAGFVAAAGSGPQLVGTGATFPYPLYQQWFQAYETLQGVTVEYRPVGSGAGVDALLEQVVDFGATDAFLSDQQLAGLQAEIVHIPTCLGAVAVSYNLPGVPELRFTPELLAEIFLGRIDRWTDRRIAEINPGLRFPDRPIVVVHRSDASGTTMIFTDFLSKTSVEWRDQVGANTFVVWPSGQAAAGSSGVAELLSGTPGAIGYLGHIYAERNGLPTAAVRNHEAYYIKPNLEAMTAAARVPLPDDSRLMLTNTSAPEGYPITGMSYILTYREQSFGGRQKTRAEALAGFLWWITHDGQSLNADYSYAPLPKNAVLRAEAAIRSLTFQGQPISE